MISSGISDVAFALVHSEKTRLKNMKYHFKKKSKKEVKTWLSRCLVTLLEMNVLELSQEFETDGTVNI